MNGITQHADGQRFPFPAGFQGPVDRCVNIMDLDIQVTGLEPFVDTPFFHFCHQGHPPVHGNGKRLGAAHPAETGRHVHCAAKGTGKMFVRSGGIRLVRPLYDTLRADIDPGSRGHLPVHHQSFLLQFIEMRPVSPFRYELRIGKQDTRRILVRPQDTHRFPALDQQGFVVFEIFQRLDDQVQ